MSFPENLKANAFAKDPRVAEAKKLLINALKEHQAQIKEIHPPQSPLKESYHTLLATLEKCRGTPLWFPYLGSGFGKGPLVELLDGSVRYDFISGIGPHYWGHSHPEIISASIDAALSDTIMQGNLQQNADALELMQLLTSNSKMDHCFLTTSGAMANENALKLIFHKKSPASRILTFERCFMGRTLTLSQITDKASFRQGLPSTLFVDYVPFFDPERPKESTTEALNTIKQHLSRYPKAYAAMCFELVQGEAGFYPGSSEFFTTIMTFLKDNDIIIFVDEVQTFGRTPQLFAFQHFELNSLVDIVTIGKLSQVCATLFKKDYQPPSGLLSQTFTGSTSAIRAGTIMIRHLLQEDYFGPKGKIQKIFEHFSHNLQECASRSPDLLQGPFGIGTMIAFTPLDGKAKNVKNFLLQLFEAGVIGFIAGDSPSRARFLIPAGAVTFDDIDAVTKIIKTTLGIP